MKTRMKLGGASGAIAVALMALSFSFGSSSVVLADDSESLSVTVQDTVLVPVKDLRALEERLAYLEGAVTALSQSWQHINMHRICVSDASGAETCITKAQLDAVLVSPSHVEASPAEIVGIVGEAKVIPAPEPVTVEAGQKDQAPDQTGAITGTSFGAETSTVQSVTTTESIETNAKAVSAEISQDQVPAQPGATALAHPIELKMVPDNESSATGDLPQIWKEGDGL